MPQIFARRSEMGTLNLSPISLAELGVFKNGISVEDMIYARLNGWANLDKLKFLNKWDEIKDCFDPESRRVMGLLYAAGFGKGEGLDRFFAENNIDIFRGGNYILRPKFIDVNGFLKFNEVVAGGLPEQERIALIAYWLGEIGLYYDDKRKNRGVSIMFEEYSTYDAIARFIGTYPSNNEGTGGRTGRLAGNYGLEQPTTSGICGDINGSIGHLLASRMGLEQNGLAVFTRRRAHVVSFIKGKQGYYMVDYENAYILGNNLDLALDGVFALQKRFTPFAGGTTQGLAFEESATEQLLYRIVGITQTALAERQAALIEADSYGSVGGSADYSYGNFRIGAFVLNSPPSMTSMWGASIDYSSGKDQKGVVFIPRVYFAAMEAKTAGTSYPIFMSQFTPVIFKRPVSLSTSVEAAPVSVDIARTIDPVPIGRATSTIGIVRTVESEGNSTDAYLKADLRWVHSNSEIYNIRKVTSVPKIKVGLRNEKGSIELDYTPASMSNILDVNLSKKLDIAKNIHTLVFLQADMFENVPGEKKRKAAGTVSVGASISFLR